MFYYLETFQIQTSRVCLWFEQSKIIFFCNCAFQDMDTSSGFCSLIFSVTDSGPGISEHMIPLIFQPFEEVRPGDFSDDDNRGSGLGLW